MYKKYRSDTMQTQQTQQIQQASQNKAHSLMNPDLNQPPTRFIDHGPKPHVVNIETATLRNNMYRATLWTGEHLQLTLMSIDVGGDIGLEVHPDTDQFLRIEEGEGIVKMGPDKNTVTFQQRVADGFAIFVPAGTWHNLINTGQTPLKLYVIYAPPEHPRGTVHETKKDAMEDEH